MSDVKCLVSSNPRDIVPCVQNLLKEPLGQLLEEIRRSIEARIEGRGFRPVAVTVGGGASTAGVFVALAFFGDSIHYVITSPEAAEGRIPPLKLTSEVVKKVVEELGLELVTVPFDMPSGAAAERLQGVMREGAIIVNGVSAELALWLGRNAGVGRLIVYRPQNGIALFRYV